MTGEIIMKYVKSEKYNTPKLMAKIMGPNPIKLTEELLRNCKIPENARIIIKFPTVRLSATSGAVRV